MLTENIKSRIKELSSEAAAHLLPDKPEGDLSYASGYIYGLMMNIVEEAFGEVRQASFDRSFQAGMQEAEKATHEKPHSVTLKIGPPKIES